MTIDKAKNFIKAKLSVGINNTDTTLNLQEGEGAKFENPVSFGEYNLVLYDSASFNSPANDPEVEIVRVTGLSGDQLTIKRAQEGTSASNHNQSGKEYSVEWNLTAGVVEQIREEVKSKADLNTVNRQFANINAYLDIYNRARPFSGYFYDHFDGSNNSSDAQIDLTKTYLTNAVSAGTNSVNVDSTEDFEQGSEFTIYEPDGTKQERIIVQNINGNDVTFTTNLVNGYSKDAIITRSLANMLNGLTYGNLLKAPNLELKFYATSTCYACASPTGTRFFVCVYNGSYLSRMYHFQNGRWDNKYIQAGANLSVRHPRFLSEDMVVDEDGKLWFWDVQGNCWRFKNYSRSSVFLSGNDRTNRIAYLKGSDTSPIIYAAKKENDSTFSEFSYSSLPGAHFGSIDFSGNYFISLNNKKNELTLLKWSGDNFRSQKNNLKLPTGKISGITVTENLIFFRGGKDENKNFLVYKYTILNDFLSVEFVRELDFSAYPNPPVLGADGNSVVVITTAGTYKVLALDKTNAKITGEVTYKKSYAGSSGLNGVPSWGTKKQIGFEIYPANSGGVKVFNLHEVPQVCDIRYNISSPSDIKQVACWVEHTKKSGFKVDIACSINTPGESENFVDINEKITELKNDTEETTGLFTSLNSSSNATIRLILTRTSVSDNVNIKQILGAIE